MVPSRRQFIATSIATAGSVSLWTPGVMAEQLQLTSSLAEGPFYPDRLPLDTDNDLLLINDSINPGIGEVTHLGGRILTSSGTPIRNAEVEIWQVDGRGVYLHTLSNNAARRDSNFQGYGRFLTDSTGRYYFRTIKPVAYPGRTPHIHFAINLAGKRVLTTQMLIAGHPMNPRDGLFRQIKDQVRRDTLLAEFKPIPINRNAASGTPVIGELQVEFDLIINVTPTA